MQQLDSYQTNGSGWVIHNLIYLDLHIAEFDPLRASSYLSMPKDLLSRGGYVNVQNKDLKCFLWSILAKLHPISYKHHPYRVSHYEQYENEVNMEGIEYPVNLSDIDKFENQNPDISISVFVLNNNSLKVTPIRVAETIRKTHIRLGLPVKMVKFITF